MSFGSLFSGIGLLDLGLERAGLGAPAWQVEIDPWCREVLARHWPNAERFDDVRTFTPPATSVPVVVGGFPCQPYSVAGKRAGNADTRALWPCFARVVEQARPAVVIAENVPGLRRTALRGVLADLAALGFDSEWTCFRASDLGAPHQRARIWIVAAHPQRIAIRLESGWLARAIGTAQEAQSRHDREDLAAHPDGDGRVQQAIVVASRRGWAEHCGWQLDSSPRVDDGSTRGMDIGRRKKALGNGVVVACAELVGRAVKEACSWI
jgi:DNA (cytosine-5)-methyltransferase 1